MKALCQNKRWSRSSLILHIYIFQSIVTTGIGWEHGHWRFCRNSLCRRHTDAICERCLRSKPDPSYPDAAASSACPSSINAKYIFLFLILSDKLCVCSAINPCRIVLPMTFEKTVRSFCWPYPRCSSVVMTDARKNTELKQKAKMQKIFPLSSSENVSMSRQITLFHI